MLKQSRKVTAKIIEIAPIPVRRQGAKFQTSLPSKPLPRESFGPRGKEALRLSTLTDFSEGAEFQNSSFYPAQGTSHIGGDPCENSYPNYLL